MKKINQNNNGFTLIELLVVVSIIGVLSAIAIPQYYSYKAKSRTAEVKVQLASAFVAMKSFYSEFGTYHTCLEYMGYQGSTNGDNYYAVGFQDAHVRNVAVTGAGGCDTTSTDGQHWIQQNKQIGGNQNTDQSTLPSAAISADGEQFTIGAAGNISDVGAPTLLDQWSIDQNQVLNYITIGY